jgi:DNA-damage-inducible protein D
MPKTIITQQAYFEEIKNIQNGQEFWYARELQPLLGYSKWETFSGVIEKAKTACEQSNNSIVSNFPDAGKIVKTGIGEKPLEDYKLSRYACYLIAQNGDSRKQEIALAQTYFALQTYKQEVFEKAIDNQKRIDIRNQVTKYNKKLYETAKNAGVKNYGEFTDAGYIGLYGMRNQEIIKKKNIGNDKILDRAGATELAFRSCGSRTAPSLSTKPSRILALPTGSYPRISLA